MERQFRERASDAQIEAEIAAARSQAELTAVLAKHGMLREGF